jgi:hypothetical protein
VYLGKDVTILQLCFTVWRSVFKHFPRMQMLQNKEERLLFTFEGGKCFRTRSHAEIRGAYGYQLCKQRGGDLHETCREKRGD